MKNEKQDILEQLREKHYGETNVMNAKNDEKQRTIENLRKMCRDSLPILIDIQRYSRGESIMHAVPVTRGIADLRNRYSEIF